MGDEDVKFVADRMLGRLATWLRLLGFDTVYRPEWNAAALVRAARAEARVILTRDQRVRKRRDLPPALFITSDHFREQVQQVLAVYPIDRSEGLLTRCARCNERLESIAKPAVQARVPAYVFATQSEFVTCPRCHRVYWPATHAEHIRAELRAFGLG
jgi:hypothetical protein